MGIHIFILQRFADIFVGLIGHLQRKMIGQRAVGRSENPGVQVLFGGHNLPPLVEIG